MKDRWKKNGYTILEMTIVISIISLIITIVMLNISKQRDEARDRAVMIQMENLRIAINNYRVINDVSCPKLSILSHRNLCHLFQKNGMVREDMGSIDTTPKLEI